MHAYALYVWHLYLLAKPEIYFIPEFQKVLASFKHTYPYKASMDTVTIIKALFYLQNVYILGYSRTELSTDELRDIIADNLTCRVDNQ